MQRRIEEEGCWVEEEKKKRKKETGPEKGYFFSSFLGRPRGLSLDSRPSIRQRII